MLPLGIPPEDLTAEELSLIPDVPQERTATALLHLLEGTAKAIGVAQEELVQVFGGLFVYGAAGIFGRLPFPGASEYRSVVVGYFDTRQQADGDRVYRIMEFGSEDEASALWETIAERLGGPRQ
jgi:hypothetical protein